MSLFQIAPFLATAGFLVYVLLIVFESNQASTHWAIPALISAAFLVWSVVAVIAEGPTGFWPVHTQNFWGNQVWFDLLIAIGIGLSFLVPQARAQGMNVIAWVALVCFTGCIGMLAMYARLLYLKRQALVPIAA